MRMCKEISLMIRLFDDDFDSGGYYEYAGYL